MGREKQWSVIQVTGSLTGELAGWGSLVFSPVASGLCVISDGRLLSGCLVSSKQKFNLRHLLH